MEEVCSHFCDGVDISRKDLLAAESIPTSRHFTKEERVSLRIIQAVAEVPENFGAVAKIIPAGNGHVTLVGETGVKVTEPLDWKFVVG